MFRQPPSLAQSLMLLALALACTYAPPAAAAEPPAARIVHADLDLETEAGARTFVRRVERAARFVCDADPNAPIEFQRREMRAACRANVRAQALARVDAPLVAARLGPAARTYAAYTGN